MDQLHADPKPTKICRGFAANPVWEDDWNATGSTSFSPRPVANEQAELAEAIRLSLEDRQNLLRQSQQPIEDDSTGQTLELVLNLNNEFAPLDQPDDDVAIYFGAPPQEVGQTAQDYQYIKRHFDRVHVLNSRTLRLMGDESRFTDNDLLNPTKSFRAERRLRKEHRTVLEEAERKHGGKFRCYIDLRPPREDEEAVILITELSCTRGVLTWHQAKDHYKLAPLLVLGHDEFGAGALPPGQDPGHEATPSNTVGEPPADPATSPSNLLELAQNLVSAPRPSGPKPQPAVAAEYSALRHHSALERLLQAISGKDPKLDSAPKVWTFFAIARYFGCAAHERISGWITTWLYAGTNANFVQNNPEVAYRIAMGIRSPTLVKDSFSILVGERALIEVYGEHRSNILTPLRQNVHGRKLELLDDDERNRIDHAASSLVKRIRDITSRMCEHLSFLQESTMYGVLDKTIAEMPKEAELLMSAKRTIREYVRSRIYFVLCQDHKPFEELEQYVTSTLRFRSATANSCSELYKTLNPSTRPFTKTFWLALQHTQFDIGYTNIASKGTTSLLYDTEHTLDFKALYQKQPENGITQILRTMFDDKIVAVNRMLRERERVKHRGPEGINHLISETSAGGIQDPADLTLDKLAIKTPPGSSLSRPAEEPSSPTKRRKTSEAEELIGGFWDMDNSVPPSSRPAPSEEVAFAAGPSKFSSAPAAQSEDESDLFLFSSNTATAPAVSEEYRSNISAWISSYRIPASATPSWSSIDGRLAPQVEKRATVSSKTQPTLALRQKAMRMDASCPVQSRMGEQRLEEQQRTVEHIQLGPTPATAWAGKVAEFLAKRRSSKANSTLPGRPEADSMAVNTTEKANPSTLHSSAPFLEGEAWSGTGDGSDSNSDPPAATKERPSMEAGIVRRDSAMQTAGSSSYEQRSFNGFRSIMSTPQRPLQPTPGSSNRTVLQAFSNSNTPGQAGYLTGHCKASAYGSSGNQPLYPINPQQMLHEIGAAVGNICSSVLYPPHLFHQTSLLPTDLFDTLLNVNEDEFRYLPLWVPDGNDDGSGGVFDETPVPNLDPVRATFESFGPGRIRRAYDQVDSPMSNCASDIEDISSSQAISTVGRASKLATDGTHTVTSLSSDISSADGRPDTDVVLVDPASDSASLGGIHLSEGALRRGDTAGSSAMMEGLETELEISETSGDDDTDIDTINGDDSLEKEMTTSLWAFVAGDDPESPSNPNEPYESLPDTSEEAEQAEQAEEESDIRPVPGPGQPALFHAVAEGETKAETEGTREGREEKGKAKAQNQPFVLLRNRHEDHVLEHPKQNRPAPSAQPAQSAQVSSDVRRTAIPQHEDEDEYEFL
ncbi:hypothetical protein A1O7_08788 [Cladophialophora yegresii CBS 114405]|uniref:Uncharacterized protein n=1 Tax=Cladophialophora yegresii CBS 114405 TaxID=1182544 RepID=W9VJM5_9EURO|nr:uncharacterized protein A1O7_08788 [Cladophialophora yegresii CBS 114405]EXJ55857.1 hypothetical protein A1O7_08788 [Cladophialophora yegresii CBS 114405]